MSATPACELLVVTTTVANAAQARALARVAVEQGLAACVQLSHIESVYRWQGVLQHDDEVRVVFKTTREAYAALQACLQAHHPYELPAIHAVAVAHASADYARWVLEGVQPPGGSP